MKSFFWKNILSPCSYVDIVYTSYFSHGDGGYVVLVLNLYFVRVLHPVGILVCSSFFFLLQQLTHWWIASYCSTACLKLEEYITAKAALELGASLDQNDSRFTKLISECDKHIAGILVVTIAFGEFIQFNCRLWNAGLKALNCIF